MFRHSGLRRAVLLGVGAIALGGSGCSDSKPPDTPVRDVERELKDDLAPPGAYISVLIGQRPLKLAQPAMRVTRVTLDAKRRLVIASVAF